MTALVVGASGALGAQVVQRLGARGVDVRAPARPELDLERPETLVRALDGVSAVLSTATAFPRDPRPDAIERVDRDGQLALVDAAERAGVRRFVYVSFLPVPYDFPLQRAKRAVEERLAASSLDWTVLRPGKFMEIWFGPLVGFDLAAGRVLVYGDGTAPSTWISSADVAEAAVLSLESDATRRRTIELGGPEALSQLAAVAIFEEELGRPLAREHVPVEALEAQRGARESEVSETLAALMLESALGSVADTAQQRELLPLRPTSVRDFARARVA